MFAAADSRPEKCWELTIGPENILQRRTDVVLFGEVEELDRWRVIDSADEETTRGIVAKLTTPVAWALKNTKRVTWGTTIVGTEDIVLAKNKGIIDDGWIATTLAAGVTAVKKDSISEKIDKAEKTVLLDTKNRQYKDSSVVQLPAGQAWEVCEDKVVPATKRWLKIAEPCARAYVQYWRKCCYRTYFNTNSST